MSENNNDFNVIDYRLTAIERELKELKELLITVPVLVNKLDALQIETKEELEKLNTKIDNSNANIEVKLNNYISNEIARVETKMQTNEDSLRTEMENCQKMIERRLETIEINQDLLTKELTKQKEEINSIREEPIKKSANRFNYIIDYVYKGLVAIAIGYFFYLLKG